MTTPDTTTQPEFLANNLDAGRLIDEKDFISHIDAAVSMQQLIVGMDREIFSKRGLDKFAETDSSDLTKTVCWPTTVLTAIRHLGGNHALSLADFYELGINTHINDRTDANGETEKGFPSFHRNSLDTYLRFALEFAKIEGLSGGLFTQFKDLQFSRDALKHSVILLSVDNLFIPEVMNTQLRKTTYQPSRHAELIHGQKGNSLIVTDVENTHDGLSWDSRNKQIPAEVVKNYITSPRLNDSFTRAVVLTGNQIDWDNAVEALNICGDIENERPNPILKPFFGKGIETALNETRKAVGQGLSQWEMISQTT